jgi:hypothetical protein
MVFDDIKDIPKHYPDVDVAMFHLGGTTVLGIVVTMDAKEGLEDIPIPLTTLTYHSALYAVICPLHLIIVRFTDVRCVTRPLVHRMR